MADKRLFYAVGAGDIQIEVLNGATTSNVLLKDTLPTPEIGVTIVMISRIAKAGNSVCFTGNFCKIKNRNGNVIGCILKNANGLYKMQHNLSASMALERIDSI